MAVREAVNDVERAILMENFKLDIENKTLHYRNFEFIHPSWEQEGYSDKFVLEMEILADDETYDVIMPLNERDIEVLLYGAEHTWNMSMMWWEEMEITVEEDTHSLFTITVEWLSAEKVDP